MFDKFLNISLVWTPKQIPFSSRQGRRISPKHTEVANKSQKYLKNEFGYLCYLEKNVWQSAINKDSKKPTSVYPKVHGIKLAILLHKILCI